MSEPRTNITDQLIGINVPNINESGYANQLSKAFTDINTNFKKLANRDFIKGENGDSVKIKEVDLITIDENGNKVYTFFGNLLITAISSLYNNTDELNDIELENGQKLTWLDYFNENPGKLNVIYDSTAVTTDEDEAYSSLYYTFLDGRYANNVIGKISPKEYQSLKDVSCIAVYDKNLNNGKGGFNILSNAFPTIYYEEGIGLCWKVYGSNTGIPVQGIPGRDGINSAVHIVQATIKESKEIGLSSEGEVTMIFEAFYGFKSIDKVEDLDTYNNTSALILADDDKKPAGRKFYFGSLATRKNEETGKTALYATCSTSSSINSSIETEAVINAMKQIDIFATDDSASSVPKGLFIPITDEIYDENKVKQPVHLLSATSITNEEGTTSGDYKTDVIFTPVNDYNSARINTSADADEVTNIKVDKYLYVKVNTEYDSIKDNVGIIFKSFESDAPYYNNIHKYKLETVITSKESTDFNVYIPNPDGYFDEKYMSETYGSISLHNDPMTENKVFSDNNVAYVKFDNTVSLNHYDSMPEDFYNCLVTGKGLYKWVLCDVKHTWDVMELNIEEGDKYKFSDVFRTIYTTELTPGINTKFIWFDGFNYNNDVYHDYLSDISDTYSYFNEYYKVTETSKTGKELLLEIKDLNIDSLIVNGKLDPSKKEQFESFKAKAEADYNALYYSSDEHPDDFPIIRGWKYFEEFPLLQYSKFIPVYDNDFSVDKDTALNLNYNINITGDDKNPKKSITVHGHVNCDDLNVYNLSAAGEIKNIYTKDNIIGDNGIKLSKNENSENNDNDYNFIITGTDNTEKEFGTVITKNIETNNLQVSNNISAENIQIQKELVSNGNVSINSSSVENDLSIKKSTINEKNTDIEINNIRNITINKGYYEYDEYDNKDFSNNNPKPDRFYNINSIKTNNLPLILKDGYTIIADADEGQVNDIMSEFKSRSYDKNNAGNKRGAPRFADATIVAKQIFSKENKITISSHTKKENTSYGVQYVVYNNTSLNDNRSASLSTLSGKSTLDEGNPRFICKHTLSLGDSYSGIDINSNIVINFNKTLYCYLCIVGKCSNGKWPRLDTGSNKTYLTLAAYIKDENGDWLEISDADYKYTFDYGYTDWGGYKEDGSGWGSNYGTHWRFRPYKFTPYDIYITGNKSDFVTYGNVNYTNLTYINKLLQKNGTLDIYIAIKNAKMEAYGENGKDVVQGVVMYRPRAYNSKITPNSVIKNASSPSINSCFESTDFTNASSIKLNYTNKASYKDGSVTMLVKNGIVIKSNSFFFGIGLGNGDKENSQIPYLYYYNHNNKQDEFVFELSRLKGVKNAYDALENAALYGI